MRIYKRLFKLYFQELSKEKGEIDLKILTNQQGYTLLLTLLLVIMISGFIGTLSFLTLSQQTQTEKTDENFLLSDVTEMGVEFYRANVINIYLEEVLLLKESIDNLVRDQDFEQKANELESQTLASIETRIKNLSQEHIMVQNEDSVSHQIESTPTISTSNQNMIVAAFINGSVNGRTEQYKVTFKLPNNLVTITVKPGEGNGGETEYGTVVAPPNFNETLPSPYPPSGTELCPPKPKNNEKWSSIICKTSVPFDIDHLDSSTVYVTGPIDFSNANNNNYGDSELYVDGDLNMKNLNSNGGLSFYINGQADFDNLNNSEDVSIQATGSATFHNLNNIKNLSVMLNGSGTFHNMSGSDFTLYTSGNATFGNINNLTDSQLEIRGITTFNQNSEFSNTISHHVGSASAQKLKLDRSTMIFEAPLSQSGPFEVKNSSKACIRSTSNLGMLDIDRTSEVYLLEGKAFTYTLQGGSRQPTYLNPNEFEVQCSLSGSGAGNPSYDVEYETSVSGDSILREVEYEIQ